MNRLSRTRLTEPGHFQRLLNCALERLHRIDTAWGRNHLNLLRLHGSIGVEMQLLRRVARSVPDELLVLGM